MSTDDGTIPLHVFSVFNVSTDGNIFLQVLIILILTSLNAFFASSEIALLSVNDAKLKKMAEKGSKKAEQVLKILENSSKFLSTIQVGVTFSGFLSSAFAADSFADRFTYFLIDIFPSLENSFRTINNLSVILITLLLSFVTLVFGELVPKKVAMKKSEELALKSITPLRITGIIFSPFIFLTTISVNAVLKLIGINPYADDDDVTEEEILLMVNEGQEKGVIGDEEGEMINNIFDFNDKTAVDVMTHRTEICALNINDTYTTVINYATKERYSRFPVYRDVIDNIVGILHIKDLLKANSSNFSIEAIMRAPCYVPESQRIDDVFKNLKDANTHMCVVVDEYGGTAGIITMEDILEELVGNIRDEYDEDEKEEEENRIKKIDDFTYIVDGITEIDEISDLLNIDIKSDDYETINGFVISHLGEIPDEGEHPSFEYENITFRVEDSNEKVITSIKIEIHPVVIENNDDNDNNEDVE